MTPHIYSALYPIYHRIKENVNEISKRIAQAEKDGALSDANLYRIHDASLTIRTAANQAHSVCRLHIQDPACGEFLQYVNEGTRALHQQMEMRLSKIDKNWQSRIGARTNVIGKTDVPHKSNKMWWIAGGVAAAALVYVATR
jgi:hypothetical protein